MSVVVGLNFPLRVEEVQCSLEKSSPVLGTNFPWLAVLILRYFLGARTVPENLGQLSCIVVFSLHGCFCVAHPQILEMASFQAVLS